MEQARPVANRRTQPAQESRQSWRRTFIRCGVLAFAFSTWAIAQDNGLQVPPDDSSMSLGLAENLGPEAFAMEQGITEQDYEVLAHGPVHEAFASRYETDDEQHSVINRNPPEPIDEIPPESMPDGDNIVWVPGYWDWDEERSDFIWVSGLWRDVPPGQQWVPGSWVESQGGWQWVSGFWTTEQAQQVTYLPEPPPSQELGPNVAAPGENYFWVPGCWVYENQYRWRPGFWSQAYPNWVWVPARYYWTPRGYVYTAGYWDYPPTARATLFNPIYFPNYRVRRFRPRVVVPVGPLMVHLFVRPGYRNYYFGNYYGPQYLNAGYYPWIAAPTYYNRRGFYDPMWNYYRYAAGRSTFNQLLSWNQYYQYNERYRPPRSYRQYQNFHINITQNNFNRSIYRQSQLAADFTRLVNNNENRGLTGFDRYRPLDNDRRNWIERRNRELRDFQQVRGREELVDLRRDGNRGDGPRRGLELPRLAERPDRDRDDRGQLGDRRGLGDRDRAGRGEPGDRRERGRPDRAVFDNAPQLDGDARQRAEQQRRELEERYRDVIGAARGDREQQQRVNRPNFPDRDQLDRNRGDRQIPGRDGRGMIPGREGRENDVRGNLRDRVGEDRQRPDRGDPSERVPQREDSSRPDRGDRDEARQGLPGFRDRIQRPDMNRGNTPGADRPSESDDSRRNVFPGLRNRGTENPGQPGPTRNENERSNRASIPSRDQNPGADRQDLQNRLRELRERQQNRSNDAARPNRTEQETRRPNFLPGQGTLDRSNRQQQDRPERQVTPNQNRMQELQQRLQRERSTRQSPQPDRVQPDRSQLQRSLPQRSQPQRSAPERSRPQRAQPQRSQSQRNQLQDAIQQRARDRNVQQRFESIRNRAADRPSPQRATPSRSSRPESANTQSGRPDRSQRPERSNRSDRDRR